MKIKLEIDELRELMRGDDKRMRAKLATLEMDYESARAALATNTRALQTAEPRLTAERDAAMEARNEALDKVDELQGVIAAQGVRIRELVSELARTGAPKRRQMRKARS